MHRLYAHRAASKHDGCTASCKAGQGGLDRTSRPENHRGTHDRVWQARRRYKPLRCALGACVVVPSLVGESRRDGTDEDEMSSLGGTRGVDDPRGALHVDGGHVGGRHFSGGRRQVQHDGVGRNGSGWDGRRREIALHRTPLGTPVGVTCEPRRISGQRGDLGRAPLGKRMEHAATDKAARPGNDERWQRGRHHNGLVRGESACSARSQARGAARATRPTGSTAV